MTPIKRYIKTETGERRLQLTLDPFAFILNSIAMGDVIAAAPVIKYLVDNYYVTPESYILVAKQSFRLFFPFIPDSNFRDFDSKDQVLWGIPNNFPLSLLNKKNDARFTRNTPKSLHLSHYASLYFSDRIIPLSELNYVPTEKVDVSHFNIDFSKAVILITSYRDVTRSWPANEILELAKWIKEQGLIPVFVGKTDMDLDFKRESAIPKSSLPEDVSEFGIDLRNKTSIIELVSIMALSKAVCGVDSGPIHLAGTTETPIVCGYTTVAAEYRIPTRTKGITIPITPNIECINCESNWKTSLWNFEKCFFEHTDCCKMMTSDKYISALKSVL